MSHSDDDPSDLERRRAALGAALAQKDPKPAPRSQTGSAIGAALSLSVEMVAAVLVGAALGYGVGWLFGGSPWFWIVGLFFGFAAGVRNAIRAAVKMQAAAMDAGDAQPPPDPPSHKDGA